MIKRTFNPGFRIRLHQKDLALALAGARTLGVALPQTAGAAQLMLKAVEGGSESSLKRMRDSLRRWQPDFRRELQRLLRDAGVYDGPMDGSFSPEKLTALEALYNKR